jgi:hypothetical protein
MITQQIEIRHYVWIKKQIQCYRPTAETILKQEKVGTEPLKRQM